MHFTPGKISSLRGLAPGTNRDMFNIKILVTFKIRLNRKQNSFGATNPDLQITLHFCCPDKSSACTPKPICTSQHGDLQRFRPKCGRNILPREFNRRR